MLWSDANSGKPISLANCCYTFQKYIFYCHLSLIFQAENIVLSIFHKDYSLYIAEYFINYNCDFPVAKGEY